MKQQEVESGSPVGKVVTITDTSEWLSAKDFRARYMKRHKLAKLSINSVYGWMDAGFIESVYVRGKGYLINPVYLNVQPPKRGAPKKRSDHAERTF